MVVLHLRISRWTVWYFDDVPLEVIKVVSVCKAINVTAKDADWISMSVVTGAGDDVRGAHRRRWRCTTHCNGETSATVGESKSIPTQTHQQFFFPPPNNHQERRYQNICYKMTFLFAVCVLIPTRTNGLDGKLYPFLHRTILFKDSSIKLREI